MKQKWCSKVAVTQWFEIVMLSFELRTFLVNVLEALTHISSMRWIQGEWVQQHSTSLLFRCNLRMTCLPLQEVSIKSNQINFNYVAQNPNHIASMGFTIYTVNNILCPCHVEKNNLSTGGKKKMGETSGRATEEGSLSHLSDYMLHQTQVVYFQVKKTLIQISEKC